MVRTVAAGPADTASAAAAAEAAERVLAREGGARTLGLDDLRTGENALRCALDTVGGTWSILVLTALRDGPVRYASTKPAVEGISDRMLTQVLRRFTAEGLAERRVLRTIPSHVEYELTPLGVEVGDAVSEFVVAMMRLAPRVAAARGAGDPDRPD